MLGANYPPNFVSIAALYFPGGAGGEPFWKVFVFRPGVNKLLANRTETPSHLMAKYISLPLGTTLPAAALLFQ
jgi:hypothetical protein